MSGVSQIELIIMHFYTNPNFLLGIWKDIDELNTKQLRSFENLIFGEVMGGVIL